MPVLIPAPITPLPTVPLLSDISTFSTRTDSFINALPTFRTENNALAINVYNNALESVVSATNAENAAVLAAAQAGIASGVGGAVLWVTGTNYSLANNVYSPLTMGTFRCKVAGVSTVDPSLDATTWLPTSIGQIPSFLLMSQGII